VTGYLVAEEMLEAAQVGGKALGEPAAEFARDRGVAGTGSPGRQEPGQPGALIGSPSRIERDLASR
jgi:aspartokinase